MSSFYSDSSFNPKVISDINGVRIIEPNPLGEIVPLEDMSIFLSLQAKQKSKSVITQIADNKFSINTKIANTIDLITPQDTTTINEDHLFKSKVNLTTDWTEIGGGPNIELYKDFEGFGITNVDIEIKSQVAPKVVIDFIDVRGATLFEQGSCSPYGLFFNLPYPIFELTVKGYYGKPVKYYLNLVKFNTKFNSDTGNMECKGEFIGYSFAFLSDTIVGYVGASQFLNSSYDPQGKLEKKYLDTKKFYKDNGLKVEDPVDSGTPWCDNPALPGRCYTIQDLLHKIQDFEKKTQPLIANSPEFSKLTNLIQLQNNYAQYIEVVNKFMSSLAQDGYGVEIQTSAAYAGSGVEKKERLVFKDQTILNYLLDPSTASTSSIIYNHFVKTPTPGIFPLNIQITKSFKIEENVYADSQGIKMLTSATGSQLGGDPASGFDTIYDSLNTTNWHNILDNASLGYKKNDTTTTEKYLDMGWIIKDIEDEKAKLDKVVDDYRKEVIADINKLVVDRIGFNPTIRNIFTILLCNTDAFMEILLEVAVKAENYHISNSLEDWVNDKNGNATINSTGTKKVYAWPAYFEKTFSGVGNSGTNEVQGTKEAYPGKNTEFANWPEVRFVEDFIQAFLEYQRDIELLNEDKAGKAGWDNYVPITPLEAPIWGDNNPIKYYGLVNPNDIYRVVGERMFIACDHTLFSPIRLTNDATFIPNVGLGNWTPLSNTSSDTSLASNFGEIDAWNLINSQEGDSGVRVLQSLLIGLTKDTFKTQVINVLKTKYSNSIEEDILASSLVTSNLLLSGTTPGIVSPFQESFTSTDLYKTFNPTDGIPLFDETSDTQVLITADPFNMGWANILQIIPETEVRKIEILPADGDFSKAVTKFSEKITTSTQAITFGSTEFKTAENPQPKAIVDESQKTINFVDGRLFTTLGMKDAQADTFSSWWSVDTNLDGLPVSNMGLITAWDYQGNNDVLGISLLTNDGSSSKIFTQQYLNNKPAMTLGGQTKVDPYDQVEEEGISTAFVTTPLWMDNVNKFRGVELKPPTTGYGSELSSQKIQDRNLAYLFLHTCKPTPLIIRACSNSGFLLAITDSEDTGYEPSSTYSLKAFNTAGGIAKVPKMWALALGAQLWRWKMFVGVKADGKWNKPLQPYNTLAAGDLPTGFDPLAQPGWHSYDGKKREAHSGEAYTSTAWSFSPTTQITQKILSLSNIERNDIDIYLNKIYRSSTSWTPKIQTSSFSSNYLSAQGKYVKDWADDVIGFGLYQAWSLLSEPAKILAKGHGGDLPWTISQPVTGGLDGNVISSGVASITPNACVYFNYYGLLASGSTYGKISFGDGDIGTEDDPKGLQLSQIVNPNDASGQLWTAKKIADNYNWSQLWIAPHHIPYVHPEGFAGGKGEACSYVQVFTNTMDYLDYQTIMPEDRIGFGYKEMYNYGDTVTDVAKNLRSDPTVKNLINPISMVTGGRFIHRDRVSDGNLGMVMQHLPDEVKDIFITKFEEWVDSDFGGSSNNILKEIDPINFDNTSTGSLIGGSYSWSREISKTAVNGTTNNSVALALKPNLTETKKLVSEKYWILNSTPKIWYGIDSSKTPTTNKFNPKFVISDKIFNEYLNSFFDTLQTNKTKKIDEIQKKNIEDNLGSSLKDDDVKLSFYRTFKSLTDKWISASDKNKLFFNLVESAGKNCKSGNKNNRSNGLDLLVGNGDGEKPTLASHFQYVNRVMGDIGNIAVLNVTKLLELKDNIKISLYQYISDLLAENEYLFFPLPGYINFTPQGTDKKDLEDMFRPTLSLDSVSCGPLFLSMYVGGNSKQLQIKSNANCPDDKKALQNLEDDGFSISNPLQTKQPAESQDPSLVGSKGYTAFKVVYGLDTQNHFKNIQLDQSEFSETAESLLAIDKLGKQGGTDQTSKGQNLNSIYLTRSYSCQVESLGNMMIQPMTYFDLIGVPMFSGAYLITEVRHNFKPNNATTTFKGTRQPRATIPIVVDAAIAMDMSFKDLKTNKVGQSIATVKTDGGTNTSQTQPEASNTNGNVSSSNVADDTFIVNYKTGVKQPWLDKSNGGLLPINAGNTVLVNLGSDYGSYTYFFHEAADAWKAMAAQMKTDTGVLISKTGSNYRTVDSQITLRKKNCGGNLTDRKASCSPQTAAVQELNGKIYSSSNHGYGMACDTTPFKGGAIYYSVKLPSNKGAYSSSNVCKQEAKSLGFDDCTSLAVAKAKENSASYLSSGKLNLQKVKDFYANLTGNPTSDQLRTMNDLALLWMQENAPSFGWQPLSSEPWHYEYTLQPDGGHPNFKSSYTGKIKSGDQYNVNKSNGYPDLTTLNNVKLVTASNATNTNNTGTVAKASQGKVKNVTLQNKLQSLGKIS